MTMVHSQYPPITAHDPATTALLRRLELVADSRASVLITGESGTGKHLMATYLHQRSKRRDGPFVALNCAAITEAMLDHELFGRIASDATQQASKFAAADGGTLLLDEIGELDARMQAKLLRAVQDCEGQGYGVGNQRQAGVRIVATTSRPLTDEVQQGRFRPDLFFRLNVMTLKIPALRHRPGDIGPLAAVFARHFAAKNKSPALPVSAEALAVLHRHTWPGNVRELENVMHRAVLTEAGPEITVASLEIEEPWGATALAPKSTGVHTTGRTIEAVEKDMILDTLSQCRGNRVRTATVLGICPRTLRNKLHEYERDGTRIPRPVVVAVA
jgi:two-component system, response regulator FlrC